MDPKEKLIIDIRFPFCDGHCVFCDEKTYGCNILHATTYRSALEKEIASAAEDLEDYDIVSVHIHGGKLSVLGYGSLDNFIDSVKVRIPASENTQWVIDLMPGEIDDMNMSILKLRNVDRVCCGFMGMNKDELRKLHRPYSINLVESSLKVCNKNKMFNYSHELVIGIPDQTPEMLEEHLKLLLETSPAEIRLTRFHDRTLDATQQRSYAEDTDWMSYIRIADRILKDAGMLRAGSKLLWAVPGRIFEENCEENAGCQRMGFGVGAETSLDGLKYRNTDDIALYRAHSSEPEVIAVL